jgi:hypothetical protein
MQFINRVNDSGSYNIKKIAEEYNYGLSSAKRE